MLGKEKLKSLLNIFVGKGFTSDDINGVLDVLIEEETPKEIVTEEENQKEIVIEEETPKEIVTEEETIKEIATEETTLKIEPVIENTIIPNYSTLNLTTKNNPYTDKVVNLRKLI